ncbi:putative pectate lyase 21 isoform X2 [Andrographis paniculata]|uniref:putative pectate lyase 21 isoform X2 n=1 Tax=Andrographis paniculata TaxID=175694 RepID=UPI0021E88739|nr:putative pectate lyase 21 isoform X2 [Andrographis paniculata]
MSKISLICIALFAQYASILCSKDLSDSILWRSAKNSSDQSESPEPKSKPSSCRTGNPIDDCWRCDPDWEANRRNLADCSIGFGRNAVGGRDGEFYVVNSPADDPRDPPPGTLRHAVIQSEPLWIIFDHDMSIRLKEELMMNSYKTIDARGRHVEISDGPCITIQGVSNIIIHGVYIHGCVPAGNAVVTDKPRHYQLRGLSDGDGISIFGSRDIWIDHCTLAECSDGLVDVVNASTAITVSNNYMFRHNEVMLMGHSDDFIEDRVMQVTIAFNYFGEGLVQRIPRHGYFHVVNNVYTGWKMYAIGGSANPTINSQGNVFIASDEHTTKEVTKRETDPEDEEWKSWNWRSDGDLLLNGAYFTTSGNDTSESYVKASSMVARPASLLANIIPSAGVLNCQIGQSCST